MSVQNPEAETSEVVEAFKQAIASVYDEAGEQQEEVLDIEMFDDNKATMINVYPGEGDEIVGEAEVQGPKEGIPESTVAINGVVPLINNFQFTSLRILAQTTYDQHQDLTGDDYDFQPLCMKREGGSSRKSLVSAEMEWEEFLGRVANEGYGISIPYRTAGEVIANL